MSVKTFEHIPVLLNETLEFLNIKDGGVYVDCTLGVGGHSAALIPIPSPSKMERGVSSEQSGSRDGVRILAFDQDLDAINAARESLKDFNNITYIHDNFANLKKHLHAPVDGILFDLVVSSYQIDEASRGFSLQNDGPLDMRMYKTQKLTAAHIINNLKQEEMEKIFKEFGEERFSHRIAKAIINKRPFYSTFELKEIVEKAIPTWKKRESVTRIFQSLRIAVNQELASLEIALKDAITLLKPGGRLVVLSYHSLEDRIVKHTLRQAKQAGRLNILTKKPIMASEEEIASNPRARSAKLRAAEFK